MRRWVLAMVGGLLGCSAFTSLDGIFEEGGDATLANDTGEEGAGGLIFPVEDGAPPPPCGAEDEACCDKTPCNAGLECTTETKCAKPPPCGGDGQPCCGGSACNTGLECKADKTCGSAPMAPPCGNSGQTCCEGGACVDGLACSGGNCVPCGGAGQPCCGGTCLGGLVCNGTCVPCGAIGQPCCIGGACSGSWCSPGGCTPICYLRCCDGSLQAVHTTTSADCRNAFDACAAHGKTLRIQWNGTYIYVRATACP
ncbi:MAG: hypothetical protein ACXVEF_02890 [Polyangiales bacterium]